MESLGVGVCYLEAALTSMCLTLMLVAGFNFPPPSELALSAFASLLLLALLLSLLPALALGFGAIVWTWGWMLRLMVGLWDGGGVDLEGRGSRWLISPTMAGVSDRCCSTLIQLYEATLKSKLIFTKVDDSDSYLAES